MNIYIYIYVYIYIYIHIYIYIRLKCTSKGTGRQGIALQRKRSLPKMSLACFMLKRSLRLKNTCVRQVALDKWFPLMLYYYLVSEARSEQPVIAATSVFLYSLLQSLSNQSLQQLYVIAAQSCSSRCDRCVFCRARKEASRVLRPNYSLVGQDCSECSPDSGDPSDLVN